jgi:hypothetical protein
MTISSVPELRFNVFGRLVAIVGGPGSWKAYWLGAEGKRRPADFIVPDSLAPGELLDYLADLFHEHATPTNGDVTAIGECLNVRRRGG